MPSVSQRQFAAMEAAKHGNSTLGIPQKVGAEFADATPHPGNLPMKAPKKKGPMAMAMAKRKPSPMDNDGDESKGGGY